MEHLMYEESPRELGLFRKLCSMTIHHQDFQTPWLDISYEL